jgi:DNA polymerase elongation subunit (family B)
MNKTHRVLTIDIETLPAAVTEAGPCCDLATLKEQKSFLDSSLSGNFGHILCIGYIDEDRNGKFERGVIGWDDENRQFVENERLILEEFWGRVRGFNERSHRIVGHNILAFDLKYIFKRSVVHGVRPSFDFSFAKYRSQPIFDTMCEWDKWDFKDKISLDELARVLGLESSKAGGVNGSRIYELHQAGEHEAIYEYCLRDVALTRAIYKRMVFAPVVQEPGEPTMSRYVTLGSTASVF